MEALFLSEKMKYAEEKQRERHDYPYKEETDLLNCILKSDLEGASQKCSRFTKKTLSNEASEINYTKTCVLHLIFMLVRSLSQIGFNMEKFSVSLMQYSSLILHSSSVEEIHTILQNLIEDLLKNQAHSEIEYLEKDELISKAKKYINYHFSRPLTLEEVANSVYLSPCYFSRIFSEKSGYTFQEYLTEVRIDAAQKLLLSNNINLEEVAYKVGYNDVSYFIRVFKKNIGTTPRQFTQKYRLHNQ